MDSTADKPSGHLSVLNIPCWRSIILVEPLICFELESTLCVPMIVIKRRAAVRWAPSHPVLACQLVPPRLSQFQMLRTVCMARRVRGREIKVPDRNPAPSNKCMDSFTFRLLCTIERSSAAHLIGRSGLVPDLFCTQRWSVQVSNNAVRNRPPVSQ